MWLSLHVSLLSKQKIPNKQLCFLHFLTLSDLDLELSPTCLSSHPDPGAGWVVVAVAVVVVVVVGVLSLPLHQGPGAAGLDLRISLVVQQWVEHHRVQLAVLFGLPVNGFIRAFSNLGWLRFTDVQEASGFGQKVKCLNISCKHWGSSEQKVAFTYILTIT